MLRIKLIGAAVVLTIFLITCGVIWFQMKRLDAQAQELGAVTEQLEAQKAVTEQLVVDAEDYKLRVQELQGRQAQVHTIYRERVEVIQSQDPQAPSVTVNDLGSSIQQATQ